MLGSEETQISVFSYKENDISFLYDQKKVYKKPGCIGHETLQMESNKKNQFLNDRWLKGNFPLKVKSIMFMPNPTFWNFVFFSV